MNNSFANRVEKFGKDRRQGREVMKAKSDSRKRNKTQRGNDNWASIEVE